MERRELWVKPRILFPQNWFNKREHTLVDVAFAPYESIENSCKRQVKPLDRCVSRSLFLQPDFVQKSEENFFCHKGFEFTGTLGEECAKSGVKPVIFLHLQVLRNVYVSQSAQHARAEFRLKLCPSGPKMGGENIGKSSGERGCCVRARNIACHHGDELLLIQPLQEVVQIGE